MSGLFPRALRLTAEYGVPINKVTSHGEELLFNIAATRAGDEAKFYEERERLHEMDLVLGREATCRIILPDGIKQEVHTYIYNESAGIGPDHVLSTLGRTVKKIGGVQITNSYGSEPHVHGSSVANYRTAYVDIEMLSTGETYANRVEMSRCTVCTHDYHENDKKTVEAVGFDELLDDSSLYAERLYNLLIDAPAISVVRTLELSRAARVLDEVQTDKLYDFLLRTINHN